LAGGINPFVYAENNPVNFIDPNGLKVFRCCRELRVNRVVDKITETLDLKHCFLKTDTKEAGMGPFEDGPLPLNPIGIKTKITDHTGQSSNSNREEIDNVDEDCVNRELQVGKYTGRWAPWNNCNTITNDILKKCKKKCE